MKRNLIWILLIVVIALALIAFYKNDGTSSLASNSVTLAIGGQGTADDVALTVNSLVQDNRCPVDVTCIVAGAVTVNATLADGATTTTRNFSSADIPFAFDGHSVSIASATPVKESKTTISPSDYRITFLVSAN